jgi:hypothetical protein
VFLGVVFPVHPGHRLVLHVRVPHQGGLAGGRGVAKGENRSGPVCAGGF